MKISELKEMKYAQLNALCDEMREQMISYCSQNGGYLSGNLSNAEIMTAVNRTVCEDDTVCIVGNDIYAQNILHDNELNDNEYRTGLAQTLAKARLRDLGQGKQNILVYINEKDLSDPSSLEILREIAAYDRPFIILYNERCEDRRRFNLLRKGVSLLSNNQPYNSLKKGIKNVIRPIRNGEEIIESIHRVKGNLKKNLLSEGIFEQYNIDYIGPVDGHSLPDICFALNSALSKEFPVVIHCVSVLNRRLPQLYQRVCSKEYCDPFDINTGKELIGENSKLMYSASVVSQKLLKLMETDQDIIVLGNGKGDDTGLGNIRARYPERFLESLPSIANTLKYAAGLSEGRKVFLNMYSSQLGSCLDTLRNDIHEAKGCLTVGILMDERPEPAILDLLKDLKIMMGGDACSIGEILENCFESASPKLLLYPDMYMQINENNGKTAEIQGKWLPIVNNEVKERCIIAEGSDVPTIRDLIVKNSLDTDLYDACIVNPLDEGSLESILREYREVFVYNSINSDRIERFARRGGFRASVKCFAKEEINRLWE